MLEIISTSGWEWAGALALRIVIGVIFIIHGKNKWGSTDNIMKVLSVAEPLGGLAILFGFLTQPAAIGLAIIMLGAIWSKVKKWNVPFTTQTGTGWEFDLMILAGLKVLFIIGAGAVSVDALLF